MGSRAESREVTRPIVVAIGLTAVVAPLLHSVSDLMELVDGRFTDVQMWVNLAAFLPMPFLLPGIWWAQKPRAGMGGLLGAVLYGVAFVYFTYTTVYALVNRTPSYAALWAELGSVYTVFGIVMILGGLVFVYAGLRAHWRPRWPLVAFALGVAINLVVGLIAVPDVVQTLGSAVRNAGLIAIGVTLIMAARDQSVSSSN